MADIKPLTDQEKREAQDLCVQMGECTATYYIVLLLNEIRRLQALIPVERMRNRMLGLCDGFSAGRKEHGTETE